MLALAALLSCGAPPSTPSPDSSPQATSPPTATNEPPSEPSDEPPSEPSGEPPAPAPTGKQDTDPPPGTEPDPTPAPTCDDGLQNQDETGVDCGPTCGGCVADTCFDIGQGTCVSGLYCVDTKCSATPRPTPECAVNGNPGQCIDTGACSGLGGHMSTAGLCPGPANIQCCTTKPNLADNPPFPAGYRLMKQAEVTQDMTAWAVAILHDPTNYPLFSSVLKKFGALTVMAVVQWHPPDFQNGAIHRGVTLFVPK